MPLWVCIHTLDLDQASLAVQCRQSVCLTGTDEAAVGQIEARIATATSVLPTIC